MSLGTLDVVAWQYAANRYCTHCYWQRFGEVDEAVDSEGNPVHPLTDSDVYGIMWADLEDAYGAGVADGDLLVWSSVFCGGCHAEIDTLGAELVTETVRRWREDAAGH